MCSCALGLRDPCLLVMATCTETYSFLKNSLNRFTSRKVIQGRSFPEHRSAIVFGRNASSITRIVRPLIDLQQSHVDFGVRSRLSSSELKARPTSESVTPPREKENHTAWQAAEPPDELSKKSPIGETAARMAVDRGSQPSNRSPNSGSLVLFGHRAAGPFLPVSSLETVAVTTESQRVSLTSGDRGSS